LAIVSAALRLSVLLLPFTTIVTVPFPFPDFPDATSSQGAWLCAVQEHPACAETPTACVPPVASNDFCDRSTVYTQAAAACCTAND
jgi:hypothetical protein